MQHERIMRRMWNRGWWIVEFCRNWHQNHESNRYCEKDRRSWAECDTKRNPPYTPYQNGRPSLKALSQDIVFCMSVESAAERYIGWIMPPAAPRPPPDWKSGGSFFSQNVSGDDHEEVIFRNSVLAGCTNPKYDICEKRRFFAPFLFWLDQRTGMCYNDKKRALAFRSAMNFTSLFETSYMNKKCDYYKNKYDVYINLRERIV